jgi:hypothetical protein
MPRRNRAAEGSRQWARRRFYGYFLKRSVLGRALMGAAGTFLPGMPTYLMKLGPDHLGAGYAQELDRRIAGSPPALAMRLRLLDVVTLLAEGIGSAPDGGPGGAAAPR